MNLLQSLLDPSPPSTKLGRARVLIVGLGGLGSPAALALAAAGVGALGLVDPDVVEPSNLPRQLLYDDGDVGRPKVEVAAAGLEAAVPGLRVEAWRERFAPGGTWERRVAAFDLVVDGTDTIPDKFFLNDTAVAAGRPLVHAGVLGFAAQVLTVLPGRSACYRCIFEEAPPVAETPTCEAAGVLGPVVALAGAVQASEAVRVLDGGAPAFADRLLTFDLSTGRARAVPVRPNPRCTACHGGAEPAWIGRSEAS
jgi:adenylyltransferase/sulfurtransferase